MLPFIGVLTLGRRRWIGWSGLALAGAINGAGFPIMASIVVAAGSVAR